MKYSKTARKNGKKLLGLLLCGILWISMFPAQVFAQGDTFTVIYKTNAGVEMGRVEYTVGDGGNALPTKDEMETTFSEFWALTQQKGSVDVPDNGAIWYEDADFTAPAQFPQGQGGETYTLYCKLTVQYISAGTVVNGAENKSYQNIAMLFLAISGQSTIGPTDGYERTNPIFEKKTDDGQWVEVPEEYFTDNGGIEWPNMIYFRSVADSGVYRLKDVRYTATDNDGNILYYVDAEDTDRTELTVSISPVELTLSGVTAADRACDGTDEVQLSGGTLTGVLYGDDVSFVLGTGTLADTTAGSDKPVETDIQLTGTKAENYTLKQPDDITVTISHAFDNTAWASDGNEHWHVCACGAKDGASAHTFEWVIDQEATATEAGSKHEECTVCDYAKAAVEIPATGTPAPPSGGNVFYTHIITASAGEGGFITPSGEVVVEESTDKTFTVKADEGYAVEKVLVDGKEVQLAEDGSYTFTDVWDPHTIEVSFVKQAAADPDITKNPATGDSNASGISVILMLLSGAAFLIAFRKQRSGYRR